MLVNENTRGEFGPYFEADICASVWEEVEVSKEGILYKIVPW